MKTLVTGATGFIGSQVVRQLLDQGRQVRILVHPADPSRAPDHLGVEKIAGSIVDGDVLQRAVRGVETVFHLAAVYKIWTPKPGSILDVNVGGTSRLLWACLKEGVKKVVYTSSIAALGVRDDQEPADEETPFNQWDNANEYVLSKLLAEREALRFFERGLPVVVVNPSFPFGEGDNAPTPTGKILLNLLSGLAPGIPFGGFNPVAVDSVAAGHLLAEKHGRPGQRYILGGENVTYAEFFRMVSRVSGARLPFWRIPYPLLLAFGHVSELVADHLTHTEPPATVKTVRYTHNYLYFDISKATRELGYQPHSIAGALSDAIAWFRKNGQLP